MQFPEELPPPLLSGYSVSMQGGHHRTQYLTHSVVRRKVRHRRNSISLSWYLTLQEKQTMEAFHRSTGGDEFIMSLPGPDESGLTRQLARFSGPLKSAFNGVGYVVSATFKNNVPDILNKTETDALLLNIAITSSGFEPDMADALYAFLNNELPVIMS